MTLAEFKAWFEGFTESMEGQPTAKQWKRIKERVAQIDGTTVTHQVIYRDRYRHSTIPTVWGASPIDGVTCVANLTDLGIADYNQTIAV